MDKKKIKEEPEDSASKTKGLNIYMLKGKELYLT